MPIWLCSSHVLFNSVIHAVPDLYPYGKAILELLLHLGYAKKQPLIAFPSHQNQCINTDTVKCNLSKCKEVLKLLTFHIENSLKRKLQRKILQHLKTFFFFFSGEKFKSMSFFSDKLAYTSSHGNSTSTPNLQQNPNQ